MPTLIFFEFNLNRLQPVNLDHVKIYKYKEHCQILSNGTTPPCFAQKQMPPSHFVWGVRSNSLTFFFFNFQLLGLLEG